MYIIFNKYKIICCNSCGLPQYVKEGQKNRKCPSCEKNINLHKVIVLARSNDLEKAILLVQQFKIKNKNKDTFTSAFEKENEKKYL